MIHRLAVRRAQPYPAVPVPPQPLELEACYRYCEAMARARHHNFPVASMFVPSRFRRHIVAVYAFARTADDFADEPQYEGRRARELDRWEEMLHACYHNEPPDHPVFVALADTVRKFDLPITEFVSLLQGFRTDLDVHRYATFTDLQSYIARAAAPVGHLFLYLGGYRDPQLHNFVEDLAAGLAMAKIIQDMAADFERDRIYVPTEDLRHFGVTPSDLQAKRTSDAIGALVRYEVARARALFERARPLVDTIGPELAIELALIWHGGMRALAKIDAVGRRILVHRPHLTSVDKARVVSRALAWRGGALGPRVRDKIQR